MACLPGICPTEVSSDPRYRRAYRCGSRGAPIGPQNRRQPPTITRRLPPRYKTGAHATGYFQNAISFYAVFIAATIGGGVLDLLRINPIKALYWTAIINGVLAPFLLLALLLVTNDRGVMRGQPSSRLARTTVGITMVIMFAAAIGMFIF